MKLSEILFAGFIDEGRTEKAEAILKRLTAKYGEPSCGKDRAAFISKHCVLKFPINDCGEMANDWEGSLISDTTAKGKWLEIDGFVCVMQEKLVEVDWSVNEYSDFPDWVGCIDCGQVGYDRRGRLKAYDFGR